MTFESGESWYTVLRGFTVTNGDGPAGGVLCLNDSSPLIEHNIIKGNKGWCGGILCEYGSDVTIRNSVISGNEASTGGGIRCTMVSPRIENNIISGNTVEYIEGGGINLMDCDGAMVLNNVIFDNFAGQGDGMNITFKGVVESHVANNIVYGNYAKSRGGGVFIGSTEKSVYFTNNIHWNNNAKRGEELGLNYNSTFLISHSNVMGGKSSVNLKTGAQLMWGSGMIDADPRVSGGFADMGADEFYMHLYYTGDAAPGGQVKLKTVGKPAATPVILWLGSGVIDPPLLTPYGEWHLDFPLLQQAMPGAIPGPDGILSLPLNIPSNLPVPWTCPCGEAWRIS